MRNKTKVSLGNRLVTILVVGVVALALYPLFRWAVVDSVWGNPGPYS